MDNITTFYNNNTTLVLAIGIGVTVYITMWILTIFHAIYNYKKHRSNIMLISSIYFPLIYWFLIITIKKKK